MAVKVLVIGGEGEGKSCVARRIQQAMLVAGLRAELVDTVGTKEDDQVWARPGEVMRRLTVLRDAGTKGPHVVIVTEEPPAGAAAGTEPAGA